jgi:hypothetical protein
MRLERYSIAIAGLWLQFHIKLRKLNLRESKEACCESSDIELDGHIRLDSAYKEVSMLRALTDLQQVDMVDEWTVAVRKPMFR